MKPHTIASLAALGLAAALAAICATAGTAAPSAEADTPQYDASGKLLFPTDYREWVFLSSGVDMSYSERPAMAGAHMFDNVFVPRAAYQAFKKTGVWPDKTMLVLEARGGVQKGSINKLGLYQTNDIMGTEVHVKDTTRFKGGWGFFGFQSAAPATMIPYAAACYSCHQDHAAADTTFAQFYPTLLPIATKLGTLNPAYVAETK